MNLDSAIAKHLEWKMKFRSAIAKQESMDESAIAKDNCCELGKWLHGEAKTKYEKLSSYSACVAKHATFHLQAGKIAKAINAREYQEAESMLGAGTAYASASNDVAVAILAFKKEVTV